MGTTPELQIIIVSGPERAQSATLGFAAAAAAAACGTKVVVFLAMSGAQWALRSEGNKPHVPGFQSIDEFLKVVLSSGGRVEVCSTCLEGVCVTPIDGTAPATRPEVVPGGLAALAIRMSEIPTVTF